MNLFRILTAVLFLALGFIIYIGLSDESSTHYLLHLGLWSFIFISSFFFERMYQFISSEEKPVIWKIIFNVFIAGSWAIILFYLKWSGLLTSNDPYSFGRFIYVFGTVAVSCLIAFMLLSLTYYPEKLRASI
ncbi:hypothetical protein C7391_1373 [Methanimicrococcus blatticola]|uniref:Uncharacterized protein n=1 Tax=Methanimicrococcus blatticola TaxID=91560 RepID=A0A484F2E7_9EURY|nr:hypothetical protein C7391_1373 [Methanimicrococcus blatticola]